MTSANVPFRSSVSSTGGPGFLATVGSEWTKIRSVRSTYIVIGLALALSLAMTALISVVTGSTMDTWSAAQQAQYNPTLFAFSGTIFSAILISVFGVTVVTSEYSSGMARLTFTITPRRGRVLLAKILVISLVSFVAGAISTLGMFLVAQSVFSSYGLESASLADGDALRAVVSVSLVSPAYPVIGAAIAVLLRNTAGSITAILGLIFAPAIFGGLLPRWWQENVLAYILGPITDSIAIQHLDDNGAPMFIDLPVAIVALAVWFVAFVGGAYVVLNKRDA